MPHARPRRATSRGRAAIAGPLAAAVLTAVLTGVPTVPSAEAGSDLVAATYAQLDTLRARKLEQLRAYLDRVQHSARAAARDDALVGFFTVKARFLELQETAPPPPDAVAALADAEARIRDHCLTHYHAFHDILLVDRTGRVIHAIRGDRRVGERLFAPPHRETALVRRLRADPGRGFVDYQYDAASEEPSAFFVEPVGDPGAPDGWMLLQMTVAKINRIFDRGEDLGTTGEVFLVNRERQMLTDSRFRAGTSILTQHLSAENIEAKFAEGRGHKVVTDYRGERALTAFEVVPVLGTEWLLIAKIDEDEVITRAWQRRDLEAALLATVASAQPRPAPAPAAFPEGRRVDMDEFHRAGPDEPLQTFGVSTCTAVIVGRPGHFAYLGHLSVHDRVYGGGDIDLVAHMLKRVRQFEVYPSELRTLRAVIVAPHLRSAPGVIDRLLTAGLFLDQITLVHDPGARRGDVHHDPATGRTLVRWTGRDGAVWWVDAARTPDLGTLARGILDYPRAVRQADTAPDAQAPDAAASGAARP
jgi:hypothetical protein